MKKVAIAVWMAGAVVAAVTLAGCVSTTVMVPMQVNEEPAANVEEVVRSDQRAVQETEADGTGQGDGREAE